MGGRASSDRALTARSVVASLLLGMREPQLAGQRLVRAAELFGFAEGTTRVALSRMVAGGELVSTGATYSLAGALLDRHGRQEEGRRPALRPWDGTWLLAVVGRGARSSARSARLARLAPSARSAGERAELRRRLAGLRLVEWREGVWIRPDNLATRGDAAGCTLMDGARPVAPAAAGALAAGLWDLDAWAHRAGELQGSMRASLPTLAGGSSPGSVLPASFRLAAAVVRHLRDDPLLPVEILPAAWPGAALRGDYDRYEAAFQAALRPVLLEA